MTDLRTAVSHALDNLSGLHSEKIDQIIAAVAGASDYALVPREFSDGMQNVWQGAFHAQLRARYKSRFKPDARPASAEAAAYKQLVGQFALKPKPTDKVEPEVDDREDYYVRYGLREEDLL